MGGGERSADQRVGQPHGADPSLHVLAGRHAADGRGRAVRSAHLGRRDVGHRGGARRGHEELYQAISDALFQRDYKTHEGIVRAAEVTTRFHRAHRQRALTSAWSPDGKLVAWSAGDKRVMVWDMQEARYVFSFHAQAPVTALAWSPDGQRLILGGEWGGVQLLWLEGRGGATTSGAGTSSRIPTGHDGDQSADLMNKGLEQQRKGNLSGAMDFFKQAEMACRALANKDGLAATLGNQARDPEGTGRPRGGGGVFVQGAGTDSVRAQDNIPGLAFALANRAVSSQTPASADESLALAKEATELAAADGLEQLARELAPAVNYVFLAYQRAAATWLAPNDEWEVRYFQYMQDLAAWKALPLLKRLRTKKPEPPPR